MNDVDEGSTVMGIHLRTNHSCVGVWVHGKAEIAFNKLGSKATPSYVAFTREERLVGDAALSQVALNPTNTIFEVEHLMGRKFHDQTVQRKMRSWPFKVVPGSYDRPLVAVRYKGEDKLFSAEEISSMILCQMREIAESLLGKTIRNAVITCPAYFSDAQRRATKDAGVIAELNVLHIINEPTAAAIPYGFHNLTQGSHERKNVLIFDLGDRTLDVSLLTIKNGNIDVKATAGDTHLGGKDFDNNMVDYFVKQFKTRHQADITNNPRSMRRLRLACEKAKRELSTSHNAAINIDALYNGIDFQTTIGREKFEELNDELFMKCLDPLTRCLSDAKMSESEVDEVVLVGGSTRIPKVQELLQDFFNGKTLTQSINPDEPVALGATIYAAMMVGDIPKLVLVDVTPLSLGIELKSGVMSVVIPRNTPIPIKKEIFVTVAKENQTSTVYDIYEGERTMSRENNLLGSFKLSGITPSPAFTPRIRVTFRIDADGILFVSATDMENENSAELTVTNERGRLSPEEIDRMIDDGRRYRQEDEQNNKKMMAKNDLDKYVTCVRNTLRDRYVRSNITADHRMRVQSAIRETQEWLEDQSLETEAREYDRKKTDLETSLKPFKAKMQITMPKRQRVLSP